MPRFQQAQHRRLGGPPSVVPIDIDLFKCVNDRHGHAAGDEGLRTFAQVMQQQSRVHDQLALWGGEEFLLMMPHTARNDALLALNRLQQRLAEVSVRVMPKALVITYSAGVAEIAPDEAIDAAIERADQAMCRAKTGGRARCELSWAAAGKPRLALAQRRCAFERPKDGQLHAPWQDGMAWHAAVGGMGSAHAAIADPF